MRSNSIGLRQITTEASISNYNFVAGTPWSVPYVLHTVRCWNFQNAIRPPPLPRQPFIPASLGSLPIRSMRASNDRERSILCTIYWRTNSANSKWGILLARYRFDNAKSRYHTGWLLNTISSLFIVRYSENGAEDLPRVSRSR